MCLLDKNEADWSVIRHVLEKGMKNGAVSLLKDVRHYFADTCVQWFTHSPFPFKSIAGTRACLHHVNFVLRQVKNSEPTFFVSRFR